MASPSLSGSLSPPPAQCLPHPRRVLPFPLFKKEVFLVTQARRCSGVGDRRPGAIAVPLLQRRRSAQDKHCKFPRKAASSQQTPPIMLSCCKGNGCGEASCPGQAPGDPGDCLLERSGQLLGDMDPLP